MRHAVQERTATGRSAPKRSPARTSGNRVEPHATSSCHGALDHVIGVRIPASQPFDSPAARSWLLGSAFYGHAAAHRPARRARTESLPPSQTQAIPAQSVSDDARPWVDRAPRHDLRHGVQNLGAGAMRSAIGSLARGALLAGQFADLASARHARRRVTVPNTTLSGDDRSEANQPSSTGLLPSPCGMLDTSSRTQQHIIRRHSVRAHDCTKHRVRGPDPVPDIERGRTSRRSRRGLGEVSCASCRHSSRGASSPLTTAQRSPASSPPRRRR